MWHRQALWLRSGGLVAFKPDYATLSFVLSHCQHRQWGKGAGMLASIATPNQDTSQALSLVAAIVFVVAAFVEPYWSRIVCAGLVVLSLALLFHA